MSEPFASKDKLHRATLSQQTAALLRGEILRHAAPGDRLEAESRLCKRYGVSLPTMREALGVLAQQGLLERKQGVGTFVADPRRTRHLAVLIDFDISHARASYFFTRSVQRARKLLAEAGWDARIYVGHAPPFGEAPPELTCTEVVEQVAADHVAGVLAIGTATQPAFDKLLARHGVPAVGWEHCIPVDTDKMMKLALGHFQRIGVRRPLLIAPWGESLCKRFGGYARERGMARGNERTFMHSPVNLDEPQPEAFAGLWQGNMPDAIFIGDDVLYVPVAASMLKTGVAVPEEVHVATATNKGAGLSCFFPTTRIEVDPDLFAERSVALLLSLVEKTEFDQADLDLPIALIPAEAASQSAPPVSHLPGGD